MSPKTVPSGQKRAISGHESERRYLESLIRTDYERCHPNDSFEDLKRRAHFEEDRGLLRDWLATAARPMSRTHRKQPASCVLEEARNDHDPKPHSRGWSRRTHSYLSMTTIQNRFTTTSRLSIRAGSVGIIWKRALTSGGSSSVGPRE